METLILETGMTQEVRIKTIDGLISQENFTALTTSKIIEENKLNVKLDNHELLKLTIEQIDKTQLTVFIGSNDDTIIHLS